MSESESSYDSSSVSDSDNDEYEESSRSMSRAAVSSLVEAASASGKPLDASLLLSDYESSLASQHATGLTTVGLGAGVSMSDTSAARKNVDPNLIEGNTTRTMDVAMLATDNTKSLNEVKLRRLGDAFLKERATESAQALVNQIWQLPKRRVTGGAVADLPPAVEVLPREKRLPEAKPETRWEKYARLKGIRKKSKKRGQMVWDELRGEARPRYGYQKANAKEDNWVMVDNEDIMDMDYDPFQEQNKAKRERVEKQKKRERRNEKAAAGLIGKKPTASAMHRAAEAVVGTGSVKGAAVMDKLNPAGRRRMREAARKEQLQSTMQLLETTTASMGRFDERFNDENLKALKTERRKSLTVRTNVVSNTREEKEKSLQVLDRIFKQKAGAEARLDVDKGVRRNRRQFEAEEHAVVGEKRKRDRKSKLRRSKRG